MAQIFHRSFNTLSRVSIFGAVFFVGGIAWAAAALLRSDYATGANEALAQPIPFSHEHHVSGLGIDCRYCHTTVEKSPFAGMPPTRTCMNCHQQIWTESPMLDPVRQSLKTDKALVWQRVHRLADFVYFDHSIHVKKGVGCSTCHGPVHKMPLVYQAASLHMEWCLECHRNPEKHVRPRLEIFNHDWVTGDIEKGKDLLREHGIESRTNCSTCHR